MSATAQVAQASPLAAIFERYHVGWETKNPDLIASLHSEDTIFWLHDGSDPVKGRDALRRHCAGLFAAFAAVAGRLGQSVQPKQPRPVLHIGGEHDMQVAFTDQKDAIARAVVVNGVGSATAACGEGCTLYGGGTAAPVMTWIHPGGHVYPRGTSERIVAFFRQHPRRQ